MTWFLPSSSGPVSITEDEFRIPVFQHPPLSTGLYVLCRPGHDGCCLVTFGSHCFWYFEAENTAFATGYESKMA